MDYGSGLYPLSGPNAMYQFHPRSKDLICALMRRVLSDATCPNCAPLQNSFKVIESRCGNAIIEENEQCDLGTLQNNAANSCCSPQCTKAVGAVCVSGECCNNCLPRLTTHLCAVNTSYCGPNATCTPSICSYYGFTSCAPDINNLCQVKCLVNQECISLSTWKDSATNQLINVNVTSGSVCKRKPLQYCQNGICIS